MIVQLQIIHILWLPSFFEEQKARKNIFDLQGDSILAVHSHTAHFIFLFYSILELLTLFFAFFPPQLNLTSKSSSFTFVTPLFFEQAKYTLYKLRFLWFWFRCSSQGHFAQTKKISWAMHWLCPVFLFCKRCVQKLALSNWRLEIQLQTPNFPSFRVGRELVLCICRDKGFGFLSRAELSYGLILGHQPHRSYRNLQATTFNWWRYKRMVIK